MRGECEGALVGSLVLNRFLIERRIGSGGFGVVYEAWDGRLERPVAVKAIEQRGEAGRRVLREAQAAARLNHPGIVTLYELGEEDGNAPARHRAGRGLDPGPARQRRRALRPRDRRDRRRPLRGARPRPLARRRPPRHQAAERPGRPSDGEPRAKLMDFGIARLADEAALTAAGDVVGTLAYMSPEQAEGRPAGPEADVYSLALTLYECWSGENPHRRATPAATARAIGGRARPLRRLRPDLPRELTETDRRLPRRPPQPPALAGGTRHARSRTRSTYLADHPPAIAPRPLRRPPRRACASPPPSAPGWRSATAPSLASSRISVSAER